ncbi:MULTISPECIES: uroporphyrinogen-III synthase [Sodalis]|jgi:uroporphyrinogen-III synthase|uniref:Uroporphyrinogen-III synthase n=1 Tax=Sodalis ligni TaxID=2697027 RepID=A0A4R1NDX3_9GAMM|nr:uroporphyrinogen-III synthase [Sodalis ligni]TCL05077.1 uroporphyrinogen-III synthase [Sodalis ligni]
MTILVTRPSPAGEQLVNRLRSRGQSAWHLPLIEFSPGEELALLPSRLEALTAGDMLFAVSKYAIDYAHALLTRQGLAWPPQLNYFAVGRTSGLLLHTLSGLNVDYPRDGESSEHLLDLPALQRVSGRRALILRGNGGREVLEQTLRQRGVDVGYCECYRRSPVSYDGDEQSRRCLQLGINTLIITSGEMLQQFYTLIPAYYRDSWLLACRLIVVSERLGALARQLGWTDIVVADAADNDALMRVLL